MKPCEKSCPDLKIPKHTRINPNTPNILETLSSVKKAFVKRLRSAETIGGVKCKRLWASWRRSPCAEDRVHAAEERPSK